MAEHAGQAIELAQRHGWTDEPAFGVACRGPFRALVKY
jgi:hypothetical protein